LGTSRIRLQARPVPGHGKPPELGETYERAHRRPVGLAPLTHPLFRPEEEHAASREDDVVPPVRRGNGAVEEPAGPSLDALWPFRPDGESERLPRLLAAREDRRRAL